VRDHWQPRPGVFEKTAPRRAQQVRVPKPATEERREAPSLKEPPEDELENTKPIMHDEVHHAR